MAQRTGAERFLAQPAKTASAGIILALALAALLLSGCGGSSDPASSSSSTSPSSTAQASRGSTSSSPEKVGKPTGESKGGKGEEQDPASQAAGSQSSRQGQKDGPSVAQPSQPREQAPAPAEVAHATVADLSLQSPAIVAAGGSPGHLAATYTCDGKGTSPALSWQGVPAGSGELVLFAMNLQPVEGKIFFDWALAGLDPGLDAIQSGQLPSGAVVGTNSFGKRGYEICPPGAGEAYMFAVYALRRALSPEKGFDPARLRSEILAQAGNVGLLPAIYARG